MEGFSFIASTVILQIHNITLLQALRRDNCRYCVVLNDLQLLVALVECALNVLLTDDLLSL